MTALIARHNAAPRQIPEPAMTAPIFSDELAGRSRHQGFEWSLDNFYTTNPTSTVTCSHMGKGDAPQGMIDEFPAFLA
jgi:hypothetical protein